MVEAIGCRGKCSKGATDPEAHMLALFVRPRPHKRPAGSVHQLKNRPNSEWPMFDHHPIRNGRNMGPWAPRRHQACILCILNML